jgi:uncharacterized glyoxalase superfamily protein PhnB
MRANRSMPPGSVIPELAYADVRRAATWLCDAFGFHERLRIADHRIQLTHGDGSIVVIDGAGDPPLGTGGHSTMVRVEEIDAHCRHALERGAKLLRPLATHPFGERQYTVTDIGGHLWTFSESVNDVNPSDWGGELVGS